MFSKLVCIAALATVTFAQNDRDALELKDAVSWSVIVAHRFIAFRLIISRFCPVTAASSSAASRFETTVQNLSKQSR
jgi:hypothetical protein